MEQNFIHTKSQLAISKLLTIFERYLHVPYPTLRYTHVLAFFILNMEPWVSGNKVLGVLQYCLIRFPRHSESEESLYFII